MEKGKSTPDAGELILESILCKLGRKKYAGLAIQAPRSHVLPIDGVAMDLVVCLDRSKSMGSYWQLVIETLNKGVTKLSGRDRLGIRTFAGHRHSQSILEMTNMSKEGQEIALAAIAQIPKPSSGHTNLGAALEEGLDELLRNLITDPSQPERAVRLLLYTDGKPTVGLRRLAELLEVREQKMSKLGPSAKVAVFAYGENHDVNILKSISNNYSSLYFAVTDQNIVMCLGEFYGGTRTTFYRDLVLSVRCPRGCEINTAFHCKSLGSPQNDVKKWEVHIPDMQSSERRNVIIKIPDFVREGEVHFSMQYYSIVAKGVVTISRVLDIVRDVSFDDGAKVAVDEQRNRMTSISVLRQAIARAAVHDWKEAQDLVAKQRRKIDHSFAKNAPLTRQMSKHLEHCRETFRRRGRQQATANYNPPSRIGFREEAEMSAFCQSLEAERSSSAGIEQFQTLEKRAQTEILMGELEPTLTLRRNETARLRAIVRARREIAKRREMLESDPSRKDDSLTGSLVGERAAPHPTGYAVNTMVIQRRQEHARKKQELEEREASADPNDSFNKNATMAGASAPPATPPTSGGSGRRARTSRLKRSLSNDSNRGISGALDSSGPSEPSMAPLSLTSEDLAPLASPSHPPLDAPSSPSSSPLLASGGRRELSSSTSALPSLPYSSSGDHDLPLAPPPTPYTTPTPQEAAAFMPGGLYYIPQLTRAVSVRELFERQQQEQARERAKKAQRELVEDAFTRLAHVLEGAATKEDGAAAVALVLDKGKERDVDEVSLVRKTRIKELKPLKREPVHATNADGRLRDAPPPVRAAPPSPHTSGTSELPRPDPQQRRPPPPLQRRLTSSDMRQIGSAHQTPVGSVVQRVEMLPVTPAITPFNTPESAPGRPLHPTDLNDFLQREEQAHAAASSVSAAALDAGLRRHGSGGFKERVMQLREQRRSRQVSRHRSVDSLGRNSFKDNDAEASDENGGSLYSEGERDDSESDDFTSEEDFDARHERDPAGDAFSDEDDPPLGRGESSSSSGADTSSAYSDDSDDDMSLTYEEERTITDDVSDDEGDAVVLSPRDIAALKLQTLKQLGADRKFRIRKAQRPQRMAVSSAPPPPSLRSTAAGELAPVPLTEIVGQAACDRQPLLPAEPALQLQPQSDIDLEHHKYNTSPMDEPSKQSVVERVAPGLASALRMASTEGLESSSLLLSPEDARALSVAVALVAKQQPPPASSADNLWAQAFPDLAPTYENTPPATAVLPVSAPSSASSTPYHTRTSLPFSLGSLSAYLQADGEYTEPAAEAAAPASAHQQPTGFGKNNVMDVKAQQQEEEHLTPSRRSVALNSNSNSSNATRVDTAIANSSAMVRSGVSSPASSSSSSPQVPHARSSQIDLRQLIIHIDEDADGGGGGSSRAQGSLSRGRRDTVVLVTLRSAATTLSELEAKIRAKFPNRGEVESVGVWMGTDAPGSSNNNGNGLLIPIETDDDVEELIHGNVLRARFRGL